MPKATYVCPRNGEKIVNCRTCRRTHVHLRVTDGPDKCYEHNIPLVPAEEK